MNKKTLPKLISFAFFLFLIGSVFLLTKPEGEHLALAQTDYGYYKQITIDHSRVAGDLTNYPLLFSVTDANLKTVANGGHIQHTASGGASGSLTVPADLVFSPNADGSSKYDFEVEKYDATTGELVAHVRIPSVSSSSDTTFYLVYGNSSLTTSQENVAGTWDANFIGVFHLGEGAGSPAYNSVGGSGTYVSLPTQATGKIGFGQQLDGTNDYINSGIAQTANYTFEAWVRPDVTTGQKIFGSYTGGNYVQVPFYPNGYVTTFVSGYISGSVAISAGVWSYCVGTKSGSSIVTYVNTSSNTGSTANSPGNSFIQIGARGDNGDKYDGTLDEVRISNTARTANYITTCYNNQSSPSTFYSVGSEETEPSAPVEGRLYVFGSLIANSFVLGRNLGADNANYPAEQVIFMPQYFLTLKDLLGRSQVSWREK